MHRLFGTYKEDTSSSSSIIKSKSNSSNNNNNNSNQSMVNLQMEIDSLNVKITEWEKEKENKLKLAKVYKKQGKIAMCRQILAQKEMIEKQISTAMISISKLIQAQSSVSITTMVTNTHSLMRETNIDIKNSTSKLNIEDLQDTLGENDSIEDNVSEMLDFMHQTNNITNSNIIDKEFDNLSISDSEEEINYDFPSISKENKNTNNKQPIKPQQQSSKSINNKNTSQKTGMFDDWI